MEIICGILSSQRNICDLGKKPQKHITQNNEGAVAKNRNVAAIKLNKQVIGFSGFCHCPRATMRRGRSIYVHHDARNARRFLFLI